MRHTFTIARYTLVAAALVLAGVGARPPRPVTVARSAGGPAVAIGKTPGCSVPLRPGKWRTSGGNYFWIQCAGSDIYWLGMNRASGYRPQGAMWTQLGHGVVQGANIQLLWSDVPSGSIRTWGRIELRVEADTVLKVIRDDGPCDVSRLTWISAR